ncbi:MAG: hypothetical protein CL944_01735 [Candidatus Diapherotrites archaeon]|uniref:Uncharacterized protein n=1 Tax=Candidatus Iainarchaeum sp. TaxID=3101447 RepID=A0A2D6LPX9_9ARCH|nr:hypothetical protein [Candidatus Diapherotrites archaeon]|tara:strand:+ start:500 stop:934 length:435 start_codon:yes stop_codon:yes gene_type:complete
MPKKPDDRRKRTRRKNQVNPVGSLRFAGEDRPVYQRMNHKEAKLESSLGDERKTKRRQDTEKRRKNPDERRSNREERPVIKKSPGNYNVFRTTDPEFAKKIIKSNTEQHGDPHLINERTAGKDGYWEFVEKREKKGKRSYDPKQ